MMDTRTRRYPTVLGIYMRGLSSHVLSPKLPCCWIGVVCFLVPNLCCLFRTGQSCPIEPPMTLARHEDTACWGYKCLGILRPVASTARWPIGLGGCRLVPFHCGGITLGHSPRAVTGEDEFLVRCEVTVADFICSRRRRRSFDG